MNRSTTVIVISSFLLAGVSAGAPDSPENKDWSVFLPEDSAKPLAVTSCGACHGLQQVVTKRGNEEFWSDTVWTMVSNGATYERDQAEKLIKYFGAYLGPSRPKLSLPINLNAANPEELRLIAPLAPVTEEIIKTREKLKSFKTPEDLLKVKGITKQDFEKMRPFLSVDATQTP